MFKIILLLIPISWAAVQVDLSQQKSDVDFFATGKPSLLKINGTGGKLIGNLELDKNQVKGRLKVKLDEFTTGIDLKGKSRLIISVI